MTRPEKRPQTPAQWAVRWHGVVTAALLLLSVPGFHLVWQGLLGRDEPPIVTRSQVPAPEAGWESVVDGTWMPRYERHLQELSPTVWQLRGTFNEALLRMGVEQSPKVHLGRDGWLFHESTLRPEAHRFERQIDDRRRFLTTLRDLVRAAGAELVVTVVPDKARVYPDLAYSEGVVDPIKAPVLDQALAELRELGIPAPDLLRALTAARRAAGDEPIYFRSDTHWRPLGALAAGRATAALIEQLPAARGLAPRRPAELGARAATPAIGDLGAALGLLTVERPGPDGRRHTSPMSLTSWSLAEVRDNYTVVLREGGRVAPGLVDDPTCEVLLIGTSFATENGAAALALALGRPVRLVADTGASGLGALPELRDELRAGTRAKVVVWEIVERGVLSADWAAAGL